MMKVKAYDLRVFMKASVLMDLVIQSSKNYWLTRRIQQISEYLDLRMGISGCERFLSALIIEVLKKL